MFDIVKNYPKVSDELLREYAKMEESASINESMKVSGALTHDFRPVWPEQRAVGRAFTVRARAGDNLILHRAIPMLRPGDFLICTCDGFQESGGMWGGIMSLAAKTAGCVGLVMDGCVRDSMMMKKVGFPVWSRGLSVKMSTKMTPGKINNPIVIGNVLVNPGDLVFADNDAVVVVPREDAEEVLKTSVTREAGEDKTIEEVRKNPGYLFSRPKFSEAFAKLGLSEEP